MWTTCEERRQHYREMVPLVFDSTADVYYAHWGEFFHLAVFAPGDDPVDFEGALERTHRRYFEAVGGAGASRIEPRRVFRRARYVSAGRRT